MDHYKHKAVDEGYFTQQAIRAGYIASPDHSQHQPADMREAIVREIEKERIREKIIAEEIARRRMVESEVRRELVMERQLAKQSGEGLSPCSSSSSLPFLKQQSDVTSLEGKNCIFTDEKIGYMELDFKP